ncbi:MULTISPECIES: baseplate J/gp47 family protein [unclassified Fibrobacter]|uniref:baseplate J/gp47 family protein n=1 Tax=unclassified Fibrobacter TaxID=2634177 RepID=UPI000D6D4CB5|nr:MULTISPECIES: baseplate J/gp47 family protein [unclassified Fibrobacter]PWJ59130.1 baseplate J-like protein [Fibrobacter sp. UWR4]PZW63442.1 baseplate J-like protein [Fibrobacter sp. UWR1]
MENVGFNIRDGLSQESRQFKELVKGFYSIDESSLRDLLDVIKTVCLDHDFPEVLGSVDIDDLARKVEGEADGNMEPAAALYAACAMLLLRVKSRLNDLPDKRIDFYYEKILGEKPQAIQGDSAHVIFPPPAAGTCCSLPAGTRFLAGQDENGDDVEYESVKEVCVNETSVERLFSLAVQDDAPATVTEIPVYDPRAVTDGDDITPYPLFGLTRSNKRSVYGKNARLGIALASPIFMLSEGQRRIKLSFFYDSDSIAGTLLAARNDANLFLKTFSTAFKIYLTTESDWYCVDGYQLESRILDCNFENNCLGLTFILPETVPSIVPYNPEVHLDSFETTHPVVKIEVNPQTSYNPWKHLRLLKLQKVLIDVKVSGLRSFEVMNDIGPLSLANPLQPFGPMPTVGDSFTFASDEFYGKRLTNLDLYGSWRGLPNNQNFSSWYELYPSHPGTEDFKVSLCSFDNGVQNPSANVRPVLSNLFESRGSRITPDFHVSFKDVLASSSKARYRMRLHSPEDAFMHQEYSRVLCDTLMSQALKKTTGMPLPNQPYTPELENLHLSYQARCEISTRRTQIDDNGGKIFFLHPRGFSLRERLNDIGGLFFIGIRCEKIPQRLNLFFHLKRDSDYVVSDDMGEFSWSVLCNENWVSLPAESILYNSTSGFTTSGIVSLCLPKEMTLGSKLMNDNLAWIRLRPTGNWRHCSRVYSVYSNAVEVSRCMKGSPDETLKHIPPRIITELSKSRFSLSEVCQITESFGGKVAEDKSKMRTRVAEFLYHRGRALSPRDYERIVLERFPEVHLVKCFPGLNPDNKDMPTPGYLTIVPVSRFVETKGNSWDPCLGGKILNDIKNYLKEKIPASAKVRVVNPFFERMQVRCVVDFREGYGEGECLQDLNNQINHFISPWFPVGQQKFFGWTLNENELKDFIQNQKYVKFVKELSILRIASEDDCNFFVDHSERADSEILHGLCPWSVATPMAKHFLNVVPEISGSRPISVGYGDLEIGSTFIIRRRGDATE